MVSMLWAVSCRRKGNLRGDIDCRGCRILSSVKAGSLIGQHEDARSSSKLGIVEGVAEFPSWFETEKLRISCYCSDKIGIAN